MARSFTLKVTRPLIVQAARENSAKCMIALAVHEVGGTYPSITRESISFNKDRVRYSYPTPAKAAVELLKFDAGDEVQPFVIKLHGHVGSQRPVTYKAPTTKAKKVDVTKILKGARKAKKEKRSHGPHRGIRRAQGLRVIEA